MRRTFAAIAVVLMTTIAFADTIKKTDGTVLEGEITSEDEDSVTLKHRFGDIKIPRKEIESIERKPVKSIESDLDKLKKETTEKLEALAKQAEKENRSDAAKALRTAEDDVKNWSTTARTEKGPGATPKKEDAKPLDYAKIMQRLGKLQSDTSGTEVQRQKALEAYIQEVDGKLVRSTMRVNDVGASPNVSGSMTVRGIMSGSNFEDLVRFDEPDDIAKLEKVKRGSAIGVEATLRVNLYPGTMSWNIELQGARLK